MKKEQRVLRERSQNKQFPRLADMEREQRNSWKNKKKKGDGDSRSIIEKPEDNAIDSTVGKDSTKGVNPLATETVLPITLSKDLYHLVALAIEQQGTKQISILLVISPGCHGMSLAVTSHIGL